MSIQSNYISRMKTGLIQLRVTPDEKRAFQDAASLAGVPLSSWMRERLRRAARIELLDANRQVAFLQPDKASK